MLDIKLIGKALCMFYGHKRGFMFKRVGNDGGGYTGHYKCPRCKAEWTRKIRKAKGVAK